MPAVSREFQRATRGRSANPGGVALCLAWACRLRFELTVVAGIAPDDLPYMREVMPRRRR
jgi:hypothetical protein